METVKLDDLIRNRKKRKIIIDAMVTGKIFIYPTDTIYGIGCNAMDSDVVMKIRELKGSTHPFSVIVPSKGWIKQWLVVSHSEFLKKLPGPYTLIFKKRNPDFLSTASESDSLGVRIPKHIFSELVNEAAVPFVTTSANLSGHDVIKKSADVPDQMKNIVDFMVDAGELKNPASKVVDLTSDDPRVIRE
jgi:L-threonylcarbamoyladenylate synthase